MQNLLYAPFIGKTVNLDLVRGLPSIACLLEQPNDVYVDKGKLYVRLRYGVFSGWQLLAISHALTGNPGLYMVYTYEYELVLSVQLNDLLPIFFLNN